MRRGQSLIGASLKVVKQRREVDDYLMGYTTYQQREMVIYLVYNRNVQKMAVRISILTAIFNLCPRLHYYCLIGLFATSPSHLSKTSLHVAIRCSSHPKKTKQT
jgi:hypothetical protein